MNLPAVDPAWTTVFIARAEDRPGKYWSLFDVFARSAQPQAQSVSQALEVAKVIGVSVTAAELEARFVNVRKVSKAAGNVRQIEDARAKKLAPNDATPPAPPVEQGEHDYQKLLLRNDRGALRKTHHNVMEIMKQDKYWRGVLALDSLTQDVVKRKCPPSEDPKSFVPDSEWTEADTIRAVAWFEAKARLEANRSMVLASILTVAEEQRFHPVCDYLNSLTWDRKPRLDTFLHDYFGAEDNAYTRAVGPKWMMSAVARAYEPGCQADYMLVLEGDQGIKKSSGIAALSPRRAWVGDTTLPLGDKDAFQQLRGKWIYEQAELASFKGRETEKIKQFITSRTDNYRASYAARNRDWPRQCALIGTTNEKGSYLVDPTGARRYWPVNLTGDVDVAGIVANRDHLWAEARARYQAKEVYYLDSPELRALARAEQEKRSQHDTWGEFIEEWLAAPFVPEGFNGRHPLNPNEGISTGDIALGALGMIKKDVGKEVEKRIGTIMAKLGWSRKQRRRDGGRPWLYFPPTPVSPVVTSGSSPSLVTEVAVN